MLLIGLLAVALVCLILGLIMANGVWLVASLVASAVAGYVLWRQREKIAAQTGVHKDQAAPKTTPSAPAAVTGTASTGSSGEASADKASAGVGGDPEQRVWVVDTMPQFHAEDCAAIQNLDAETITLAQALEDGFAACTVCTPGPSAHSSQQVWVVDGRPDYHLQDCRSLKNAASQQSREPQQIPRPQAVDDGFSACPDCRPDGAAKPAAPAADRPRTVWVVDGRPRYHLSDCMIIKDQQAEEIPLDQATEDGFMACSMCEPNAARV